MKSVILSIILNLFLMPCFAQEQIEKSPISLKISVVKTLKPKQSFLVKAQLTNISNENLIIDKNSLHYALEFGRENGSFSSRGEAGTGYQGNYLILAPNQTYTENQTIKLTQDEFFKRDGKYTMERVYGQFMEKTYQGLKVWRGWVRSNALNFHLRKGNIVKTTKQK